MQILDLILILSDESLNLENSFDDCELSVFEINDSISKPVQSKVSSPTTDLPRKNSGNKKIKKQIPVPEVRESICNFENPQIIANLK